MLLLTSTSDIIRVVTGTTGASINCHASWVDNASGTITPGRTNTAAIVTNTTTTVVASPAASTQRNVRSLMITNNHATVSTQVTVQHFDGTVSSDLFGVLLAPGENMVLGEDGEWKHHDANGAEYSPSVPWLDPYSIQYGITGTLAENIPRSIAGVNLAALTSGTLFLQAIYLKAGTKVTNIVFCSGTTASATVTNGFYGLYDINRNLLGTTANQGAAVWAANTVRALALTAPYTITTSGLYYLGCLTVATTVNSLAGVTAAGNAGIRTAVPIISGNSTTALTTALPNPAAAITAAVNSVWCAVT